jgi:hypothetical protein
VVEWSRALDVRLSEWCCSVSMVWVQIPSRENKKLKALKLILTLFGLIFRRIYIYKIIILSIYVPSTHAYTHVLRLSLDLPYETR